MSGLSTRLLLTLPDSTDAMSTGDTVLSTNYDLIDFNAHCVLVATLGSVTSPFNGMHVRNAADNKNYFRVNGAWVESNMAVAGGSSLGGMTDNITSQSFTTTETKILQTTFNAVTGKRYLVQASIDTWSVDTANNNAFSYYIRYASGATVTSAGSLLLTRTGGYQGDGGPRNLMVEFFPNSTAQFSVGVFGKRTNGSDSFIASRNSTNSTLWIIDWGS